MKKIGLTQRVEVIPSYGERRDCLDQQWSVLLSSLDLMPIPLSNSVSDAESYLNTLSLDGIILTGGNDLAFLENASNPAPERDAFETHILEYAGRTRLPLLGVCRGMQMMAVHYGCRFVPVTDHVSRRHDLAVTEAGEDIWPPTINVNSFHNYGIPQAELMDCLRAFTIADDGTVEAFQHQTLPHNGIMWHPERETPHCLHDHRLLEIIFNL